LTTNGSILDM